jgi:hypothetical protein
MEKEKPKMNNKLSNVDLFLIWYSIVFLVVCISAYVVGKLKER